MFGIYSLCVAALKIYPLALHMCACRNTFHYHLKAICFLSIFLLVPHWCKVYAFF